jgi:hypothetical protein
MTAGYVATFTHRSRPTSTKIYPSTLPSKNRRNPFKTKNWCYNYPSTFGVS